MTPHHAARKRQLKVPFRLQMLYSSRKFYSGFSLVMAVFMLYGPIPLRAADHDGTRYLLGPPVCAFLALAVHRLFPFNPYRVKLATGASMYRLDERDENARRFVEILRSSDCRQVALRAALDFILVVLPVMAMLALIFRNSLTWSLSSPWFFEGYGMGCLFAWMFLRVRAVSWALEAWWKWAEESPYSATDLRPDATAV